MVKKIRYKKTDNVGAEHCSALINILTETVGTMVEAQSKIKKVNYLIFSVPRFFFVPWWLKI